MATNSVRPGNEILRNLPKEEWTRVSPTLELTPLKLHQLLHEPGETIESAYFLNDGMGSVMTVQPNGNSVEVGLIGKEGFVGLPLVCGFKTSATRVNMQTDGTAYRIDVSSLQSALLHCPTLAKQAHCYSMTMSMQTMQLAACNLLHDIEQRLARRLLMSFDRIGNKTLPLTHEFLAQILGVRRASVSIAAGALQKAGAIEYTRGRVTILSRPALEAIACDCYRIIQQRSRNWQREVG